MTTTVQNTKVNNNQKVNNNNLNNNILLATKVDSRIYNDFLELKSKRKIRKDSTLLRPIIRAGIATCSWLNERGLLSLNDYKLKKILAGLNEDERRELLDILRKEFGI